MEARRTTGPIPAVGAASTCRSPALPKGERPNRERDRHRVPDRSRRSRSGFRVRRFLRSREQTARHASYLRRGETPPRWFPMHHTRRTFPPTATRAGHMKYTPTKSALWPCADTSKGVRQSCCRGLCYPSDWPASSTGGTSGGEGASNTSSPSCASTMIVCPARNSL